MAFEWNEEKNKLNVEKHGIDFVDAKEIWKGLVLDLPSPQDHHSEERFIAIGLSKERHITVIYTWRDTNRRLISARKARDNEQKKYENETR